jgi:hypothetical protein
MYIVFAYEGEVYFSAIFDGLYKIDESGELPRLSLLCCYKTRIP